MLRMALKSTTAKIAISIVLAVPVWLGSAVSEAAGGNMHPSTNELGGDCAYSQQLRNPAIREEFLAKLTRVAANFCAAEYALGTTGELAAATPLEEMYENIETASYKEPGWNSIDTFSVNCLSCHDGQNGAYGEISVRNNPASRKSERRHSAANHPIGMEYAGYAAFNNREFKSSFTLDRNMLLIDGKVGCLTCHNPLNPAKNHLVMSDRRSALCLSCHNK